MASWKETLRSWLNAAPRVKTRRTARLDVLSLEERANPVIGAFDVPYAVDFDTPVGATNLSGVARFVGATSSGAATLLDRGDDIVGSRHVLVPAHLLPAVGDRVEFYSRAADGTVKVISVPVASVAPAPGPADDLQVLTLAAVAPQYAADYPIYRSEFGSEISRPYYFAGYGVSGTGQSGQSTADLQKVTVKATGGTFALFSPDSGTQTAGIPWNASALDVQTALTGIGLSVQVTGISASAINDGNYEIRFTGLGNAQRLQYRYVPNAPLVDGANNGVVSVITLTNGNSDGQFQRLTINATGGTYTLSLNGNVTSRLDYNATETQIQAALQQLPGVTEVTVRLIPTGAPSGAGSFQISFDRPTTGFPVLVIGTTDLTGTASAYILQDAPRQVLRLGVNEYDGASGSFLTTDFDAVAVGTDDFYGAGDDGAPGFIDIGSGKLAVATLFSSTNNTKANPAVPTSIALGTRISKYTDYIESKANVPGYAAIVDMQYQLGGNDGIPDTFRVTESGGRVEIYVRDSKFGPEKLIYAASDMASVVLRGTNDDDTFIVDVNVSPLVSIEGGGGKNSIIGPNVDTAWTISAAGEGTGDTANTDFNFKGIRQITGGSGKDTFVFGAGGSLLGFIDGGAGLDTIDFSIRAATTITVSATGLIDGANGTIAGSVPLGGQFRNMDNIIGARFGTADILTGPPSGGTWTHAGVGGTYVDSVDGKSFSYSNFESLIGNTGDDVFNILSFTKALSVNGGAGANSATVDGTAGNDAVTLSYLNDLGDGTLTGLGQTFSFTNLAAVDYDAKAGTNSYLFRDQSGTVRGTPTDPSSGIVFAPSGASAGTVRVGSVSSFGIAGINDGLTVDGGSVGSTLMVLGTSGTGLQSAYGEAVIGNGRDAVTVTDSKISVNNSSAGDLLAILPGFTLGSISFGTIYVAAGNEPLNVGDVITVTPSFNVNLLVDGQGPANTARPGDRVVINATGSTSRVFVNDPTLGPPQNRVTQDVDGAAVGLINIESGTPPVPGQGMIAVASDAGITTSVQVFDRLTRQLRYQVVPFGDFNLGATVASGDFNGDGIADMVVGAGPGGGPRVAVFNGIDGSLMADFFAYEDTFRGGVNVSAADFNGDGRADVVLGTGVGGGPRVRIFSGVDFATPLLDALVYEPSFRGGVNVSTGDFNADGTPDLITSAGTGGGPRVVVLSGNGLLQIASFFVFDPNSRAGFYAAGGDVNGDGFADVIAGAGAGEPARVRVISGATRLALNDFYVNDPLEPGTAIPSIQFDAGVRVAAADVTGDGIDDVLTAKGPGSLPTIRAYQLGGVNPITNALFPTLAEVAHFDAFDGAFAGGLYIGGSN